MITRSKKLECVKTEGNGTVYTCDAVVESTWMKIGNASYYSYFISKCGMQWTEKYLNVMLSLVSVLMD